MFYVLYQVRLMTHKKTEVAKKLKSLPDLLGAINAYYDCSTGLDMTRRDFILSDYQNLILLFTG